MELERVDFKADRDRNAIRPTLEELTKRLLELTHSAIYQLSPL